MSKHVGARTHASVVGAQHAARISGGNGRCLAAAGLALFLALGPGAVAQAGEDAGAGGGGGGAGGAGAAGGAAIGGTADAGDGSSADGSAGSRRGGDSDAREVGDAAAARPGTPDRPGGAEVSVSADGTIELSATSSDAATVTRVVVTPSGRWTTTVETSGEDTGREQTSRRRG